MFFYFAIVKHVEDTKAMILALPVTATLKATDQYEELHGAMDMMASLWYLMRLAATFNACCILLRFFKSFRSNPRLSVVTRTLQVAFNDIAHFMVILVVVFMCFVISGHILFGVGIREFADLWTAVHFVFTILMGDFDLWALAAVNYLFAMVWFWAFMILVLLLLLNMFLVILMDAYVVAMEESRGGGQKNFFWRPPKEFRWMNYPPKGIRYALADFPVDTVTWTVLADTFGLKEAQAKRLIEDAQTAVKEQVATEDPKLTDVAKLLGRVDLTVRDIAQWVMETRSELGQMGKAQFEGNVDLHRPGPIPPMAPPGPVAPSVPRKVRPPAPGQVGAAFAP